MHDRTSTVTEQTGQHQVPAIQVSAAGIHNLKQLDLALELGKIHLVLGLSGSGKSALLRQTIYATALERFALGLGQFNNAGKWSSATNNIGLITGIPPIIDVTKPPKISRRSTLGTLTGLHQLFQILFVQYGTFQCSQCAQSLSTSQPFQIRDVLLKLPSQTKLIVLAPLWSKSPSAAKSLISQAGYVRIKYGTDMLELQDFNPDDAATSREMAAVVDRLVIKPGIENRLLESIEAAWKFCGGFCDIQYQLEGQWLELGFSEQYFCRSCQQQYAPLNQSSLSFFSGIGACSTCHGLGEITINNSDAQTRKLKAKSKQAHTRTCPDCQGLRLGSSVRALNYKDKSFADVLQIPISELIKWVNTGNLVQPTDPLLIELTSKISVLLKTLESLGIGYLTLKSSSYSLSTGEYQRAILARNSGKQIRESTFLFEEPGSGLHSHDIQRLIQHLKQLAEHGNTLLISDPHPEFMELADEIWELGPGAGDAGGQLMFHGTKAAYLAQQLAVSNVQLPIRHLASPSNEHIILSDCHLHNLKHVELIIPRNRWTCITGVSGSGKSTLVLECLVPHLRNHLGLTLHQPLTPAHGKISQQAWVRGLRVVTQGQLQQGDSANLLSTLNIWNTLRLLLIRTKYARLNGWTPAFFSWKNPEFCCSVCGPNAQQKANNDSQRMCSHCAGSGINKTVLRATFKEHHLADILQLTCSEASQLFSSFQRMVAPLQYMNDLGLGYLTLGRTLNTLSRGELSRTHLARELVTGETELCFILDEPSAGLSAYECQLLVQLLVQKLDAGHTLITIDHRPETINHADREIQLGPAAGEYGGEIVMLKEKT